MGHALSRIVTRKIPLTQPQTRMVTGFAPFMGQIVKKIVEVRRLRRMGHGTALSYIYIHLFIESNNLMTI